MNACARLFARVAILAVSVAATSAADVSASESLRGLLPLHPIVPEGLGVNTHFTHAKAGEMEMLAEGGFTWIRMDLAWSATEREQGNYDFSAYEKLLNDLEHHKIRALLILDYHNRLYDQGLSPHTDEGRAAFARWAAAAVAKFKGRGVMWEMYNEPNIIFWKPKPNPPDYIKLAIETGKAIRATAPDELYVGPATSQIDLPFLEQCFQAGLLDYWDAVTVHPYRQQPPETVVPEYAQLRRIIDRYAPKGKVVPIISGEWGYSVVWRGFDPEKQARYLARQWLVNLSQSIPLSIWYDWRDDGKNPQDPEHHFGTVRHDYRHSERPVFEPKPAFLAAQTLTRTLQGMRFNKRIELGNDDDWCLLFSGASGQALAVWTTASEPREIRVPVGPGEYQLIGLTGERLGEKTVDDAQGLPLQVSGSVIYLLPKGPNESLSIAAAWQTAPHEVSARVGDRLALPLSVRNPLNRPIRVSVNAAHQFLVELASGKEQILTATATVHSSLRNIEHRLSIEGLPPWKQRTEIRITNPLTVHPAALFDDRLVVRVEYPSADGFDGEIRWLSGQETQVQADKTPLRLPPGTESLFAECPFTSQTAGTARLGWRVASGAISYFDSPLRLLIAIDEFGRYQSRPLENAYKIQFDGDRNTEGWAQLQPEQPAEGPAIQGCGSIRIDYRFGDGWKFLQLKPTDQNKPVPGKPRELSLWVFGDASGNRLRMRVIDTTGQCFQPNGEKIAWRGWRQVSLTLDDPELSHWGGKNDGIVHYPIRLDTLVLIDSAHKKANQGRLYVAAPMWVE